MGWSSIESRIEGFRDRLAGEPAVVLAEVEDLLCQETGLRPANRLRLLGLAISAGKKLGEWAGANEAALEGLAINTTSAVARADFLLQLAILRMVQHKPEEALDACGRAHDLMLAESAKPEPSSKEGQRRRRWMQATQAAAHVVRGELFLHLDEGSADQALSDALTAFRLTANLVKASSHTRRVHLSAVTLLCALMVRAGTTEMAADVLRLVEEAEHQLIYQCRVPPNHVHRLKLKWCRALALARMGSFSKAERLLVEVVEGLQACDLKDDARRALAALVQVIEQTNRAWRAQYYRLKYGKGF